MPWFLVDKSGYIVKVFGDGEKALRKAHRAQKDGQTLVHDNKPRNAGEKFK